jgi:hypothetical protein
MLASADWGEIFHGLLDFLSENRQRIRFENAKIPKP